MSLRGAVYIHVVYKVDWSMVILHNLKWAVTRPNIDIITMQMEFSTKVLW